MKKYLLFTILLISIYGFACSCPPIFKLAQIQKIEIENSECIFIGEVIEVDNEELTYKIRVTESLDGNDIPGNIYTGKNWKGCEPFIEENGKWIIYGHMEDGFLSTNKCGISRSFENPVIVIKLKELELYENKTQSEKKLIFQKLRDEEIMKARKELENEIEHLRKIR